MRLKSGWLGLKRVRIRQSWSKSNLYQLSKLKDLRIETLTMYQQKWKAKYLTRTYHGAQINEKQWQRMFTPRLNAVVALDPHYLSEHDGSEMSAGRGSGKDARRQRTNFIPYMHMTYAPLERRLDTAVFRALFASSIRQARNMIVHGHVKVNGERMSYTSYLLNPGDMFQVERDLVLLATGAPKPTPEKEEIKLHKKREAAKLMNSKSKPGAAKKEVQEQSDPTPGVETSISIRENRLERASTNDPETEVEKIDAENEPGDDERRTQQKAALNQLASQIQTIVGSDLPLDAKRKQGYRAVKKELQSMLSKYRKVEATEVDTKIEEWTSQLARLLPADPKLRLKVLRASERGSTKSRKTKEDPAWTSVQDRTMTRLSQEPLRDPVDLQASAKALKDQIHQIEYNPKDISKIYVTPWRPRPYMAPFVFIPRYLEVNQNICAAVYLRHPVARMGLSEVPSPFGPTEMQLSHSWYLRRR